LVLCSFQNTRFYSKNLLNRFVIGLFLYHRVFFHIRINLELLKKSKYNVNGFVQTELITYFWDISHTSQRGIQVCQRI